MAQQRRGDTTDVMLDYVGYKLDALRAAYRDKVAAAGLPADESARLTAALEAGLTGYTYPTTCWSTAGPRRPRRRVMRSCWRATSARGALSLRDAPGSPRYDWLAGISSRRLMLRCEGRVAIQ